MTQANNLPVRIAYLIGEDKTKAIEWAEKQGWIRIAVFRFTNMAREDIRVIDSERDFRSFGSGTKIYRGYGFEKRPQPDHDKWYDIIDTGRGQWGNELETPKIGENV